MRPQHITAENAVAANDAFVSSQWCFNEAAAYHCGKHRLVRAEQLRRAASMRPQHITAENSTRRPSIRSITTLQ